MLAMTALAPVGAAASNDVWEEALGDNMRELVDQNANPDGNIADDSNTPPPVNSGYHPEYMEYFNGYQPEQNYYMVKKLDSAR